MKTFSRLSRFYATILVGVVFAGSAFAQFGGGSPSYSAPVSVIQGNQPLVAGSPVLLGSNPVTLTITPPSSGITFPFTLNLGVSIPLSVGASPGVPLGVNISTAVAYCTLSTSSVTFANAGSTAQVVVSVNVPTPVTSGDYFWKVSGTNWPAVITDPGAIINATVLPPLITPTVKPTITNLLPANGTNFIYTAPTPVAVPISFNAASVSAVNGGAAITQLSTKIDTTTLSVVPSGLGSTNSDGTFGASGSVTTTLTDYGPHTITVSATNAAGTTFASTQINILAPPKITNTNNPSFVYGQSGSFAITWTGYEAPTFSLASGALPAGVTLNPATGVLSGAPTAGSGSSFTFAIKATNSVGSDTHTFTLPVSKGSVAVTANAVSKVFGTSDPALTYTFTPALASGNSFSGVLSRDAGENVGTYAINQNTLSAGANYTVTYTGALFTITKAPQVITFGALPAKSIGAAPFALTATGGGSGNAITYTSSNPAVATVSGSTVTVLAAGTTVITANQAGNSNYNAANPVSQTLTVSGKLDQTITFGALGTKQVGTAPFTLTATASSGLAVTYTSSNPSVATVSGSTVTVIAVGTTTITASQAGNTTYNPAPSVSQSLTVTGKANQTITFGALPSKQVGDAAFALTATASSGLTVTYTSSNTAVATVSGSIVTIKAIGTTVITASQAGNDSFNAATPVSQTLTVTAQTCPTTVMWLPPVSLGQTCNDGSVIPIKFYLRQCCNSNTGGYSNDDDDDNGHYGCDDDGYYDGRHYGHSGDYSGYRISCRHGTNGRSTTYANCRADCDHDDDDDGCVNLRDKTVVISIYEVGSSAPAIQYKYGTGSPNPPDYIIDGDYKYQLNFQTARGTHRYHIDIYRYPPGSTTPKLVGTKEFSVR